MNTHRAITAFHHRSWQVSRPLLESRRFRLVLPNSRAVLVLALTVLLALIPVPCSAQQPHPTESQVKAAYLYNFGKFVRWQPGRVAGTDSLEICVLGKDPFGAVLDSTVAGESIEGKKITAKRLARIQDEPECRILFISSSEEGRLSSILAAAQRFNMLTVSDIPHFADQGGIIEFVVQQDKIRFEVNRAAAEQSGIVLSSELLKVAAKVIDKAAPRGQP